MLVGLEVPVPLRACARVVVAKQVELELAAHLRHEARRRGALQLAPQDRPRGHLDGRAGVLAHRVAQDERRPFLPRGDPEAPEIGDGEQVAVALLPARERIARSGIHLHVAGEQVVAEVHAVGHDLIHEKARLDALADETPVEVRKRGDDGVDRALRYLALQALEIEHAARRRRHVSLCLRRVRR